MLTEKWMGRERLVRVVLVCVLAMSGALAWAQQPLQYERNVPMRTRDGVVLRADVYRPLTGGTHPVLLQRTPYNKDGGVQFALEAVDRGYMVVIQDVRGRYASDGDWYPFKNEMNDGYDAVEWAAGLPGSNGKVGMWGGSYVGATQMLAAVTHPPHLAGICPVVTASNYHENWTYQGGAFEQWFNESWTSGLSQDTLDRKIRRESKPADDVNVLPLTQYPVLQSKMQTGSVETSRELAPYFEDWAKHTEYDDYWKQWAIAERYGEIRVPALTVAAWYDIFQGGSVRNYMGMRDHAGTEEARNGQRLLIVIGGHAGGGRKIGAVDFGDAAAEYDEGKVTLDWYDYLLQGKQNEFARPDRVKLFVMGDNKWRWEKDWPLERAKETKFYLHSDGKANSSAGDGKLSLTEAAKETADSFVYDPAKPVPTTGGPLCCGPFNGMLGPQNQSTVEDRKDVLVYTTAPLDHDVEVTGQVKLELYAKSSAVDTDFTGKLVDVGPDGFAKNLTEGILRAKYRESTLGAAELMKPGEVYKFEIDLWSTSNVFKKGHSIRLEVSSSNFPRFDRNLNTGKSASESAAMVKATNTILHDAAHESVLVLPMVPQE
ncbi:CocE/NonD family hydrolase [Acidicapsa dinghuensis]|uniref:CocE/NonD family hydrolase n=1 Tax=Acidicapsa dinghuensis TaxID=2218256 RepID=A0ABW1EHR1_9BACT|nr:CocE/NonD family hydrolase [Acidicapsa dinghuensis]